MSNLKALANLIKKPKRLKALLSYGHKGYLEDIGWFTAFDQQQAVDKHGQPIPWVTYSFIDFIKPRLNKQLSVFEFGSGNSTLFYALHVKHITAIEHDEAWYQKIVKAKAENSDLIFSKLEKDGAYSRKAADSPEKFDIIIVDGRDRVNCCRHSLEALSEAGVIVLDDSEREQYNPARLLLIEKGFQELPFTGISPGLFYNKATSVFYKSNNCLGI